MHRAEQIAAKKSVMKSMSELPCEEATVETLDRVIETITQTDPIGLATCDMPEGMQQGNIAVPYEDLCVMIRDT